MKPIHVKPSFYALFINDLKVLCEVSGWNLVIHGSLNRDMDIILLPWSKDIDPIEDVVNEIAKRVGGEVLEQSEEQRKCFPHGRESYIININRGGAWNNYEDAQYYFDISVFQPN